MGKFHKSLTELSARDMIMAGYYSLTFLSLFFFKFKLRGMMNGLPGAMITYMFRPPYFVLDQSCLHLSAYNPLV